MTAKRMNKYWYVATVDTGSHVSLRIEFIMTETFLRCSPTSKNLN